MALDFSGVNISIEGKAALVTGAASGIGNAVATLFAARGARVALLDLESDKLRDAAAALPGASAHALDVRDPEAIDRAVDAAAAAQGGADILVNCAGIGPIDWAEDYPRRDWDATLAINLSGTFFMSQAVGRRMIAAGRGGKIVALASQAALVAIDKHVAYSASKAGVLAVVKSLAYEWGRHRITVNAISPTATWTPMIQGYWDREDVEKATLANLPVGRYCRPEEIAAAALYLCSPAADMITGSNLVIDGGYTIH